MWPGLPPAGDLAALRQRALLERRGVSLFGLLCWLSSVATLAFMVLGLTTLHLLWAPPVALAALAVTGLAWLASMAWARRRVTAALAGVRACLGAETPWRSWVGPPLAGVVAVAGLFAWGVASGPSALLSPSVAAPVEMLVVTLLAVGIWRARDPALPLWVFGVIAAWGTAGVVGVWACVRWLGPAGTLSFAAGWLLSAPFGAPFGSLLARGLERDDALGRWSRAVAPLLPPTQRVRALRLAGDPAGALAALQVQVARFVPAQVVPDTLHEVASALEAVGDLRAIAVHAWSARTFPEDPRPFVGLATALAAHDPALALAYARHAEDCELRRLVRTAGQARALRERLERG